MVQSHTIRVAEAHVAALPGRGEEPSSRLAEDLDEDALSALEGASCFFDIQSVHLVDAPGDQRSRAPASQTPMRVAVKEELLGALSQQPAVVGMRRQEPLTGPVRDHRARDATSDKRREVANDRPSLTRVGWRGVVDTDKEAVGIAHERTLQNKVNSRQPSRRAIGARVWRSSLEMAQAA